MVLSNILTKTSQMKFDFQLALDYLCNETSFRYCRLMDVVENNGCPSVQFKVNDSFIITDIPFLITGVIIAAFISDDETSSIFFGTAGRPSYFSDFFSSTKYI